MFTCKFRTLLQLALGVVSVAAIALAGCAAPLTTVPNPASTGVVVDTPTTPPTKDTPVSPVEFPQANLCNDTTPDLTELAGSPLERVDNVYLSGGFSYTVVYQSKNQQRFQIKASGADDAEIQSFLKNLKVCFEAIPTNNVSPPNTGDLNLDQFLIDVITESTGLSVDELREKTGDKTLRDVLKDSAIDADKTVGEAYARAKEAIEAAVTAGTLTREQADELLNVLQAYYAQALDEPGAPILAESVSEADFGNELAANKANLVVELVWLPTSKDYGQQFVVYYVMDPSINNGQNRYYRVKCQTSAWVRIRAWAGSMTVYFWRYTPNRSNIGSQTANATATAYPPSLSHSTYPTVTKYDASTHGWQNGSSYTIYGGWTEEAAESGSTCP